MTSSPAPASSEASPAIHVEHLTKRFGGRVAFEDVTFDVGQVFDRERLITGTP